MLTKTTRNNPDVEVLTNVSRRETIADRIIRRLSRVTSSGMFVPEIDGLRFIAIMSVVLFHVGCETKSNSLSHSGVSGFINHAAANLFSKGFFGVELFFVISGFILSLPFAKHHLFGTRHPSVRNYYLRRITRLEPPYIISLLVCTLIHLLIWNTNALVLAKHVVASMFYSHKFIFGQVFPLVNSVLWSLEVEIQFYIFAPILFLMFRIPNAIVRRLTIFLGPILLRELIFRTAWHFGVPAINTVIERIDLFMYIPYFSTGLLLADIYLLRLDKDRSKHWYWDCLAAAMWIIMIYGVHRLPSEKEKFYIFPLIFCPAILIAYIAAFKSKVFNAFLRNRWITTIGGMCYTIYLYHMVMIMVLAPVTSVYVHSLPLHALLYAFLSILLGGILFVCFEKPFMYKNWPQQVVQFMRR